MARRHVGKKAAKDVAEGRMETLFELASEEAARGGDERARRYVQLALRIGERYKVPSKHKRKYCPKCRSYFVPPRNVRVRTRDGKVVMTCLGCGHIIRYPVRSGKVK
jgi:ribonuclease P protein subunit RPR2